MPLIFDELESLNKREAERLPDDIYNYSLGIGGQALKKDGTKREVKLFSGVRLTTGEHSIVQQSDNGGVFKRVLDIRAAKLFDEDFASDLYASAIAIAGFLASNGFTTLSLTKNSSANTITKCSTL